MSRLFPLSIALLAACQGAPTPEAEGLVQAAEDTSPTASVALATFADADDAALGRALDVAMGELSFQAEAVARAMDADTRRELAAEDGCLSAFAEGDATVAYAGWLCHTGGGADYSGILRATNTFGQGMVLYGEMVDESEALPGAGHTLLFDPLYVQLVDDEAMLISGYTGSNRTEDVGDTIIRADIRVDREDGVASYEGGQLCVLEDETMGFWCGTERGTAGMVSALGSFEISGGHGMFEGEPAGWYRLEGRETVDFFVGQMDEQGCVPYEIEGGRAGTVC